MHYGWQSPTQAWSSLPHKLAPSLWQLVQGLHRFLAVSGAVFTTRTRMTNSVVPVISRTWISLQDCTTISFHEGCAVDPIDVWDCHIPVHHRPLHTIPQHPLSICLNSASCEHLFNESVCWCNSHEMAKSTVNCDPCGNLNFCMFM